MSRLPRRHGAPVLRRAVPPVPPFAPARVAASPKDVPRRVPGWPEAPAAPAVPASHIQFGHRRLAPRTRRDPGRCSRGDDLHGAPPAPPVPPVPPSRVPRFRPATGPPAPPSPRTGSTCSRQGVPSRLLAATPPPPEPPEPPPPPAPPHRRCRPRRRTAGQAGPYPLFQPPRQRRGTAASPSYAFRAVRASVGASSTPIQYPGRRTCHRAVRPGIRRHRHPTLRSACATDIVEPAGASRSRAPVRLRSEGLSRSSPLNPAGSACVGLSGAAARRSRRAPVRGAAGPPVPPSRRCAARPATFAMAERSNMAPGSRDIVGYQDRQRPCAVTMMVSAARSDRRAPGTALAVDHGRREGSRRTCWRRVIAVM